MEEKRFCSIRETARRTGISEALLRQLVAQKKLPHIRANKKVILDTQVIMERLAAIAEENCVK